MLSKLRVRDYNFKLVLYVTALTLIGIFAIGSADEYLQNRQIYGLMFAIIMMVLVSLFDYSLIIHFHWIIYAVNIILLLMVLLFGETVNNAQRWLILFGIQFQPSELAKILLILFYAQFIMKCGEKFNSIKNLVLAVALLVLPVFLIYRQPDLSTSLIVILMFTLIIYIGGLSWKVIAGVFAIVIPVAIIFLAIVTNPDSELLATYQQNRIIAFLDKESYSLAEGYQQENSVMAIGSGQLYGKGYRNNLLSSVKNANFIAEQETDFIFAVIGEEFGFIGTAIVIVLIMLITVECLIMARRAKDLAGTIIATAVGGLIGIQGFINIGVATYVLPNTGLPLPFVSYGLTSLVSLYIGIGFVLNVGLQRQQKMME
ncbi:MAG: rod shape-determining protein RodA [Lachnospiraceae bacterium]|jgi:rod shape determining protein RodA|nr:rod shape-determining protein RodA [Lachnospiraceae bacterium]